MSQNKKTTSILKASLFFLSFILLVLFISNYQNLLINTIFLRTSQIRGITYTKSDINIKKVTDKDILLLLENEDNSREITSTDLLYRAFKYFEPNETASQILINNFYPNILGFYSVDDTTLYISKKLFSFNTNTKANKYLIAHEFTHYLQDSKYSIRDIEEKFDLANEENADRALSYLALLEGDATFTAMMYVNNNDIEKIEQALLNSFETLKDQDLHIYIKEITKFHYIEAPLFVLNNYKINNNYSEIDYLYKTLELSSYNIINGENNYITSNTNDILINNVHTNEISINEQYQEIYSNYSFGAWEIRMILSRYVDEQEIQKLMKHMDGSTLWLWYNQNTNNYMIYWIISLKESDSSVKDTLEKYCISANQHCNIEPDEHTIYITVSSE